MRVRLTKWDGAGTVGVVSTSGTARWNGSTTGYSSLYATDTGQNVFAVYGVTSGLGCPGGSNLVVPFVDLQQGSQGPAVEQMQRLLNYFGSDAGPVDGIFGQMGLAAVRDFQAKRSLTDRRAVAQRGSTSRPGVGRCRTGGPRLATAGRRCARSDHVLDDRPPDQFGAAEPCSACARAVDR